LLKLLLLISGVTLLSWQLILGTSASAQAQAAAPDKIVDFEFQPPRFDVAAGATVVWTNLGPTPHTVASSDMSWSSDILMVNDTYSFQFTTPGTYEIFCTLHPAMLGSVTVK